MDFSRRRGGAERYLVDLCTQMADEGHEVHVYAEHWQEEDLRIHLHRIKTIPFPKSLRLLSFAERATNEMRNGGYDITFGVGNTLSADVLQPHGGVHWVWFWRSLGAYEHPILWAIKFLGRVLSPKQWVQGWIEDAPYKEKSLPRIIAISEMVKQDMIRWYGIPQDRIVVIYNGVDIERFHPRNRHWRKEIQKRHGIGEEFVVLFVSNNFRLKGLDCLIKGLSEMKREGLRPFKLLILGRDRQAPYLRLSRRLGVSDEVLFVGSTDEPEKYYGAADLLVHPTFYDPCSLTVVEALASGLPVITTALNGAHGVITHGEDGWVLGKTNDARELKKAILYFLEKDIRNRLPNPEERRRDVYSEKLNFDQVMKVLREVALG